MAVVATIGALAPHFPFRLADYDWAFHLVAFSVLTVLGTLSGWPLLRVVAVTALVGILIEIAQVLIPTRTASGEDLLLNLGGIGMGLIGVLLGKGLWRSRTLPGNR